MRQVTSLERKYRERVYRHHRRRRAISGGGARAVDDYHSPAQPHKYIDLRLQHGQTARLGQSQGSLATIASSEDASCLSAAICARQEPSSHAACTQHNGSCYWAGQMPPISLRVTIRRLLTAKDFYQRRIPRYARWRMTLMFFSFLLSALSAALANFEYAMTVPIIGAVAAATTSWMEYRDLDRKLERYTAAARQHIDSMRHISEGHSSPAPQEGSAPASRLLSTPSYTCLLVINRSLS